MSYTLPPVPLRDIKDLPYTLQEWLRKIQQLVSSATGAIPWIIVDKTGSNLTDLTTRNHNDLQNKQGGTSSEYYHLTSAEYTGLGADDSSRIEAGQVYTRKESSTLLLQSLNASGDSILASQIFGA
jgi:hypothetical protein